MDGFCGLSLQNTDDPMWEGASPSHIGSSVFSDNCNKKGPSLFNEWAFLLLLRLTALEPSYPHGTSCKHTRPANAPCRSLAVVPAQASGPGGRSGWSAAVGRSLNRR